MKLNKIILPVVASAMLLTGCDDQIMEWGTPEGQGAVTVTDIPLQVREVLSNYDDIKVYAAQYHPNMVLGLGVGKDIYMGTDGRHELAVNNFQMITWGNAMKMDAIVTNSGALNFANLDPALDALTADGMPLYGHNFIWHTQQNQSYLRSVIAPTVVINTGGDDDKCENVVTNSDFEDGTDTGWTGWSHYKREVVEGGHDSKYALKCTMDDETTQNWDCQLWWPLAENLKEGVTYYYGFWVKSPDNINVQFIGQNASYGGLYKTTVTAGSEWVFCEGEFTYDGNPADVCRVGLQFGGTKNSVVYVDDFKFGKKVNDPMENVITNSNFDGGNDDGWQGWSHYTRSVEEGGHSGKYALKCTMDGETAQNWDCQLWWPLAENLKEGVTYCYSFYIKSPDGVVAQFIGQNSSYSGIYKSSFTAPNDWLKCEGEFTYDGNPADICRIGLQFGGTPNTVLWIDDFKFGKKKEDAAAPRRAGSITYVAKTPEEKREALLGAMESWIKGMADHLNEKGIVPVGYDVINEAITDGQGNKVRGVDNVFGGDGKDDDGNVIYDGEPTETEEEGLNLNWVSGHFYWGYYVKDYAVKAFEYARQYLPAETKLFYNDYNLEVSDAKRAAAIKFVQDIDAAHGSPIVDGIGTQMHITLSGTSDNAENNAEKVAALRAQVDKQFKELAATGKLIRITELDIILNTSSPSSAQAQAQANAYRTIIESYFENVPAAQQSGITIWSLTDSEDEHVYWKTGETPNLWDAKFLRKWAYKGVCDGLAGEDIGLTFGGEDYKAFYERNNVDENFK